SRSGRLKSQDSSRVLAAMLEEGRCGMGQLDVRAPCQSEAKRPQSVVELADEQGLAVERALHRERRVEQRIAEAIRDHALDHVGGGEAVGNARLQSLAVEEREEIFAAERQVEQDHRLRREVGQTQRGARRESMVLREDGEGG